MEHFILSGFNVAVKHNTSVCRYENKLALVTLTGKDSFHILLPTEVKAMSQIMVKKGVCTILLDYMPYQIEKDMFVLLREGTLISNLSFSEDFEGTFLIMNRDFLHSAMGHNTFPVKEFLTQRDLNPVMKGDISECTRITKYVGLLEECISLKQHPYYASLVQNALCSLVLEIWNIAARLPQTNEEPLFPASLKNKLVFTFVFLVREKCRSVHEVADYAELLHVSAAHLTRTVKESTGRVASEWITQILVSEIKLLLQYPGKSIQEIAAETGFSDQASLSKFFKKHTGMAPIEYRKVANKHK